MNNIRTLIPRILGSFWDRAFHDSGLVDFIKGLHYRLSNTLYLYLNCVGKGASCLNDVTQYHYEPKSIPADSCVISTNTIGSYKMEGTVYQSSKVKTIAIPTEIIGSPVVVVSGHVWVSGINMKVDSDYVTLYMPMSVDLETEIRTMTGEAVNNYVTSSCYKYASRAYRNYSELLRVNMDNLPHTVRKALWRSSVLGARESDISSLLSYLIGNDVSISDSTVTDIWYECGKYMIATADSHVYSGYGVPLVDAGWAVHTGDLLFYGLHKFNKNNLPHPDYIPSVTIRTSVGDILARNTLVDPIKTAKDYIPDMCNKVWADKVSGLVNRKTMLTSSEAINPLHYAFTRILPPSGSVYSLSELVCTDSSTISVITNHTANSVPSSCLNPVYRHYVTPSVALSVSCAEPKVTIAVTSANMGLPISIHTPIVHII